MLAHACAFSYDATAIATRCELSALSHPHLDPPALPGRCQGALLSLSAAHAELGHPGEAMASLQEALKLAQQQVRK